MSSLYNEGIIRKERIVRKLRLRGRLLGLIIREEIEGIGLSC